MGNETLIGRLGRRAGAAALAAAAGLALGGCGGDDPAPAALWCAGVCAAVQRCGYQDPTCQPDCVAQRPQLANLSTSGAAAQKPCLAGLSCRAIGGDATAWKTEVDACWDQAKPSVDITEHLRRFCASHAMVWFDCGYTLSLDDCEHDYGMWDDAVLDRLAACDSKPGCDQFQACENGVFDNL